MLTRARGSDTNSNLIEIIKVLKPKQHLSMDTKTLTFKTRLVSMRVET